MLTLRKSQDRGPTRTSWLDSKHSFSFGNYYDPQHTGFGDLLVINEDVVAANSGFPTHPHRDMEILTYILEGELSHRDSIGTGSAITPGEVQRMSAGTGISHSEYNASRNQPVHLLQIWIHPEKKGLPASYEQKNFKEIRKPGELTLLASRHGEADSLIIHQDAKFYVLDLNPGQSFGLEIAPQRIYWIQQARGQAQVNDIKLHTGDGLAVRSETQLRFEATSKAEILIFDLKADNN